MINIELKSNKIKRKIRLKNLKKVFKNRMKLVKFARRKNCYVVDLDAKKCLSCQKVFYTFMCTSCAKIDLKELKFENGMIVNKGVISKNRFKPVIQNGEFMNEKQILELYKNGARFMSIRGDMLTVIIK